MHRFGHTFHQSHVAAAIHQRVALPAHPAAQFIGQGKKILVYTAVGRTKNTYFHRIIPLTLQK
jgi:hypothetical protein